ncbi:MAG: DUF5069 domain-containing protein [Verrucomicrobiales bacterium]
MDLTQRPPRSARVRLGGFCILPRALDKCRATLAGKQGEFKFACPLDMHFFDFAGINPDALKEQVKSGKGDGEILEWVMANSTTKPSLVQIIAWSAYQDQRGPTDLDTRQFFADYHAKVAPKREDVGSWFDILDIDDYVSYGGKA